MNTVHFTSYEKIAESPDQWHLDEAGYRLLAKIDWVVTEKIHGANFCFVLDDATILCANRKQLLSQSDDFFHYQSVLERLRTRLQHLFLVVKTRYPSIERVFLYGELFGGEYPHPDVPPDPSVQAVQSGVYYAPTIEFCAFDLALEGKDQPRTYLDGDLFSDICKEVALFSVLPLFVGTYQEALEYPIGFPTTLPARLGLPPLAQENKAEGVVIKPLKTLLVETPGGRIRPIFKRKIVEFAEDKRFHQAQKWSVKPSASELDRLELLKWEAFNLVTENRLQSAISKIGAIGRERSAQASRVFRLFIEDVFEQLVENQGALVAALTARERSELMAYIQEEARQLFKKSHHKA